jgi:glyoxylase-like metal-dependent hydrolase (beta-lactamase superfamily II)
VRDLDGLPPEILLVPLVGHTWGHAGVAVSGPGGWLLHAGDAYFYQDELNGPAPSAPPGVRGYQSMMEVDRAARLRNQDGCAGWSGTTGRGAVLCGHDAAEFAAFRGGAA